MSLHTRGGEREAGEKAAAAGGVARGEGEMDTGRFVNMAAERDDEGGARVRGGVRAEGRSRRTTTG